MYVDEIIKSTNGTLINGNNIKVQSFSIDSRTISENDLFISIKGEKYDANDFIIDVLKKGAIGVIYEGELDRNIIIENSDKIFINVDNAIEALQRMARYKRSLYDIPVVAITGSVGKTSTKDIISNVMSKKFNVLKTEGNLNNHIGLPLTLLKLKDHDAMCIEMGMNHLGELKLLTDILKPTIAVITNVGTAHIGNLGSRENILKAKLEILEGLKTNKVVINNDNDLLHEWAIKSSGYDVVTYGINNDSRFMSKNINLDIEKSDFVINYRGSEHKVKINIPGIHFIYNSLCAISVADILNIDIDEIKEGILDFQLSKKRMENKELKNNINLLIDCYNANFDSMKASLEVLGKYNNRKIAVLGDMLELGEYSKELHEKIGLEVDKNNIDILIVVGNESKYIYNKSNIKEKYVCKSNIEVVNLLNKIKRSNDIILFKASNAMHFNEIIAELS